MLYLYSPLPQANGRDADLTLSPVTGIRGRRLYRISYSTAIPRAHHAAACATSTTNSLTQILSAKRSARWKISLYTFYNAWWINSNLVTLLLHGYLMRLSLTRHVLVYCSVSHMVQWHATSSHAAYSLRLRFSHGISSHDIRRLSGRRCYVGRG